MILYRIFNPLFEMRLRPTVAQFTDDPALVVCIVLISLALAALLIPSALEFVRRWTNHKHAALPDVLLTGIAAGLIWPALREAPDWSETHHCVVVGTLAILVFLTARLRTVSRPKRHVLNAARFGPDDTAEGPLSTIAPDSDRLGRLPFCEMLKQKLATVAPHGGHVIGLSGSWGSGKTTVLNHCAGELGKLPNGPLVIAFDAWLFRDTGRLIEGLLGLIGSEIENNYLYRDARSLARQLARILSAGAPRFRELPKLFEPPDNPVKLRQRFAELIAKTDERFVVLIDDVERLSRDEVHALLKTVREGALVPGITYLLSYDRAHLVELLGVAGGIGAGYLEKIVQEELELPRPDIKTWHAFAQTDLNAIVEGAEGKLVADFRERLTQVEAEIADVLQTPRHVKRVRIAVENIAARMRRVLNPFDLLVLELLRQRHRPLYDLISKHRGFFCESRDFRSLFLRADDNAEDAQKPLRDAVEECMKAAGLVRPGVEKLLSEIFPRMGKGVKPSQETCFRLRRLCDPAHFDWYFKLERPDHIPEQGILEDLVTALNTASTKVQRKALLAGYLLMAGDNMLRDRFAGLRAFSRDFRSDAILPTAEALLESEDLFAAMAGDPNSHRYNPFALFLVELIAGLPSKAEIAAGMGNAIARSPNVIFASELLVLAFHESPSRSTPSPLAARCQQEFDSLVERVFIHPLRDIFADDTDTRGIVIDLFSNKNRMRDYLSELLGANPANWLKLLRQYFVIHDTGIGEPLFRFRADALRESSIPEGLIEAMRTLPQPVDQIEARMVAEFLAAADAEQTAAAAPEPESDPQGLSANTQAAPP